MNKGKKDREKSIIAPQTAQLLFCFYYTQSTPEGILALIMKCFRLKTTAESFRNDTSDLVRISVGSGTAVLEVALAILSDLAGNTN